MANYHKGYSVRTFRQGVPQSVLLFTSCSRTYSGCQIRSEGYVNTLPNVILLLCLCTSDQIFFLKPFTKSLKKRHPLGSLRRQDY